MRDPAKGTGMELGTKVFRWIYAVEGSVSLVSPPVRRKRAAIGKELDLDSRPSAESETIVLVRATRFGELRDHCVHREKKHQLHVK
jgi:hypothetical protein